MRAWSLIFPINQKNRLQRQSDFLTKRLPEFCATKFGFLTFGFSFLSLLSSPEISDSAPDRRRDGAAPYRITASAR